jgi:hypothetical protein
MDRPALVIALAAGLTIAGAAQADEPLVGFGDVKLGESFAALSAAHKITQSKGWKAGSNELYDDADVQEIAGLAFSVSYQAKAGAVAAIGLRAANDTDFVGCLSKFRELASVLTAKYGNFDHPASQTTKGTTTDVYVVKSFADRYISLAITAVDGGAAKTCTTSIVYGLGKSILSNVDKL